ncbi:MAG TPA: glycosyltransferase, partial [Candidatus Eisenbacteria bacterium]|nr:glycosyltransferase [Candidatus Eisenbacteria bacterium]
RFTIVGRNPVHAVRALASQPGIEVTGAVPDVRPYLAAADVACVPLRVARGLQNKMLEAMAMGLPVVATTPAYEGLDAPEGAGIEVADDPAVFAERVVGLLRDDARRLEAGRRARAHVEARHKWADHGAALEALLEGLVASRPKPGRREAVS